MSSLIKILADMHASRAIILCYSEFDYGSITPDTLQQISTSHGVSAIIHKSAICDFKKRMPTYNLHNLSTDRLVNAVFDDIVKSFSVGSPKIRVANGCCTKPNCPTAIFYECVVNTISEQSNLFRPKLN